MSGKVCNYCLIEYPAKQIITINKKVYCLTCYQFYQEKQALRNQNIVDKSWGLK